MLDRSAPVITPCGLVLFLRLPCDDFMWRRYVETARHRRHPTRSLICESHFFLRGLLHNCDIWRQLRVRWRLNAVCKRHTATIAALIHALLQPGSHCTRALNLFHHYCRFLCWHRLCQSDEVVLHRPPPSPRFHFHVRCLPCSVSIFVDAQANLQNGSWPERLQLIHRFRYHTLSIHLSLIGKPFFH